MYLQNHYICMEANLIWQELLKDGHRSTFQCVLHIVSNIFQIFAVVEFSFVTIKEVNHLLLFSLFFLNCIKIKIKSDNKFEFLTIAHLIMLSIGANRCIPIRVYDHENFVQQYDFFSIKTFLSSNKTCMPPTSKLKVLICTLFP